MRSFLAAIAAISTGGCATVSMYPVQSSSEFSIIEQDSALKSSADAFCELAETENWVVESEGLARVARALFDGEEMSDGTATYAVTISAETGAPAMVLDRLIGDASEATAALNALNAEAALYLETVLEDEAPSRRDVMRFERALIWAGKAERGFSNAADILAERGVDATGARQAIEGFSLEIDETRALADQLADHYAKRDGSVSS